MPLEECSEVAALGCGQRRVQGHVKRKAEKCIFRANASIEGISHEFGERVFLCPDAHKMLQFNC